MQNSKDIVKYCRDLLKVKDFEDYCHNGLQVEGVEEIGKIVVGVTLSQQLIEVAIERGAQMIIVHHGIFGDQIEKPPVIKGVIRNRLKMLLENNINLLGFHLPLDAHDEIGNNISLSRLFGLKNIEAISAGYVGDLENEVDFEDFIELVGEKIAKASYVKGTEKVKRVAIISGGSSPEYAKVKERGADTLICGDLRENIVREAEEVGINIINAGHYNTERLGIKNLGEKVAEEFGVDVEYVEVPNVF